MRPRLRLTLATAILASTCVGPAPTAAPMTAIAPSSSSGATSPTAAAPVAGSGCVLLVGRIVTMADPPEVEALLIVDGRVSAMGVRPEVEVLAPPGTATIELGANVAYPGFIDAHSHWIGDREFGYGPDSADEAMQAAVSRGWT
jgi:imidazolonepropionase-like amidohydrolase